MTKEKQIEEMATAISNYADKHEWELHEPELEDLAIELYNAGYRKASKNYIGTEKVLRSIDYRPVEEVRRETAKEILKSFENRFSLYYPYGILTYDDIEDQIISLAEKYGVEVEE